MPPEAKDVVPMMQTLTKRINEQIKNKELPAPIIAALAHYQFATIHPYYDGNGRTARLLTTFILHKIGYGMKGIYSLEEYYAKNLQWYYNALAIGKSHNYYFGRAEANITPFLEYFTEEMAIAFQRVREKAFNYEEKRFRDQELEAKNRKSRENDLQFQTEKLREVHPQQRQVLFLFQKNREVNLQEIANYLGINTRSANGLVKNGLNKISFRLRIPLKKQEPIFLGKIGSEWLRKRNWQSLIN
jgi:Fic family protein